ncbi:hypothetical protein MRB53_013942 [Persea americana]|uniref:Uncharacterized protein n=1 Tax=Persea americana TaxID=3435 RepID=A0ACC2K9K4_PERAE|nr:hypothetical protein MRB53_013942 [Persea americana]
MMIVCFVLKLEESKKARGERVEDGTAQRDRPLYEILKENKDKKDAEFNERFKHRPPKALDEDETEFLDNLEMPADPNFTSPVTGHLLPPCLAATPLPASGYGSHPLQRPLPPVPANGHCCHLLSPLLLLPYLCKLSALPATASSPPSAPDHCDLLQIRGHFQTTGHPQTSGHSPYNLHNLLTSRPVHLNPYSAAIVAFFPSGHYCRRPSHLQAPT